MKYDIEYYLGMLRMPRGTEWQQKAFIKEHLLTITDSFKKGRNRACEIPNEDGSRSDVAFMSHVDTVHKEGEVYVQVTVEDDWAFTEGSSCLGADCTTGVYIMMNMIDKKVPGLYFFFVDEEKGCLGSRDVASLVNFDHINHAISFDRLGKESIITHQMGHRTASEEFSEELSARLAISDCTFSSDDGGVFTDSNEFTHLVANCTNLSVGYYGQHTVNETQDLRFLEKITEVYCNLDWSGLPIGVIEPETYSNLSMYEREAVDIMNTLKKSLSHSTMDTRFIDEMVDEAKTDLLDLIEYMSEGY